MAVLMATAHTDRGKARQNGTRFRDAARNSQRALRKKLIGSEQEGDGEPPSLKLPTGLDGGSGAKVTSAVRRLTIVITKAGN